MWLSYQTTGTDAHHFNIKKQIHQPMIGLTIAFPTMLETEVEK